MERIVSELELQLEAALAEIGREKDNLLRYDLSVKQLRATVGLLNERMRGYPFAGKAEEIRYFKELAPKFYSKLFYFMKLQQLESFRRYYSRDRFRLALQDEQRGVERFYTQHAEVCRCYYQHFTYWDECLFTRAGTDAWPAEEVGLYIGPEFTLGSYWASWILANERYRVWLGENLEALDSGAKEGGGRKLPWKRSATDLVERIYAEYLSGAYGDLTLKEVMEFHGEAYGIDLTWFSSTIQELGRRKKSQTKYLDMIREKLAGKLGEIE